MSGFSVVRFVVERSLIGLIALMPLGVIFSSNEVSAHNGQTLTLQPSVQKVSLDGKIDEMEWSDPQKLIE